ncbi:prephenate dehydratase [Halopolyspora algeriensis]|uniref:Prephenate dehydratase n=1 Tax=Halopolyspora algeriensis TaxID=1500506 RepID=A0A368W0V6_9ACTN|nr:prephenate dehydratase [Halopolyspora algeriensis]RCW47319.1 prephenate dehydratase [Halopolyspora algeriensis]TQM42554.1 prephenate dehydratase [Halopolyspora algeriensis]
MPRIAFLGPPGTFTEQATRALTADFDAELVPFDTVPNALDAVRSQDVLAAGVPMENSVEGSVSATLDALTMGEPLVAVAEAVLPIRFHVLVRRGTTAGAVSTVASHPHAIAQVRSWLDRHLPEARVLTTSSTAAAAAEVDGGHADAAVVAPVAAERHPALVPLDTGVADVADARTRFLLIRRPGALPEPTGADRTSIAVVAHDEVGALTEVLSELSLRGINLSRIESRPIKDRLGEYRFFLDFDGHVADARIGDALTGLRRRCEEVRFLGSYPKADRSPASVRPAASEQAFRKSMEWLAEVRAGRLA